MASLPFAVISLNIRAHDAFTAALPLLLTIIHALLDAIMCRHLRGIRCLQFSLAICVYLQLGSIGLYSGAICGAQLGLESAPDSAIRQRF
jgi:hypothetical protein